MSAKLREKKLSSSASRKKSAKPKKSSENYAVLTVNKNLVIDILDQWLHSTSMINDDQKLYNITEGVSDLGTEGSVYLHITKG